MVPPSRPKAAPSQKVVTATCENATDCTDELQAAFASGAETVHVPRLHGGQRSLISPYVVASHFDLKLLYFTLYVVACVKLSLMSPR